jgi:hypothetical protein
MDNSGQMSFDFSSAGTERPFAPLRMKQIVLAWLASQNPTGLAADVPAKISKYKAAAAAFWSVPVKKTLSPVKTVIVDIRHSREKCWPDCSEKNKLLPLLNEYKKRENRLREIIKLKEPFLRDGDTLFDEVEIWHFEKTANPEYHECRKKIEEVEHALYHGSRFEQIRRANIADCLYLAVPDRSVHPNEVADGWGLLYFKKDFSLKIVKEAFDWNCPENKRMHLVQNIAMSSTSKTLFSFGINKKKKGGICFTPVPRRRNPVKNQYKVDG